MASIKVLILPEGTQTYNDRGIGHWVSSSGYWVLRPAGCFFARRDVAERGGLGEQCVIRLAGHIVCIAGNRIIRICVMFTRCIKAKGLLRLWQGQRVFADAVLPCAIAGKRHTEYFTPGHKKSGPNNHGPLWASYHAGRTETKVFDKNSPATKGKHWNVLWFLLVFLPICLLSLWWTKIQACLAEWIWARYAR